MDKLKNFFIITLIFLGACNSKPKTIIEPWIPYDESEILAQNADHPSRRMHYKLIQSRVLDKNDTWAVIQPQISDFSEEDYQNLKPLILEQDIPTIQSFIRSKKLTYKKLTQWYLYRIVKFENDKDKALNNIISINPDAVKEAKLKDRNKSENDHLIYGMPVLLKDNINAAGMPTTAGAHALLNNYTSDAFITAQIKNKGGIILGKTNLSEWANYISQISPNGYSAVGGQTLNPYGPRKFDTGGSSSGSGSAGAANYAAATVGTETSGSILSPSSSNSIVGLKPTIGLLSRGGIVPISSTFDTPGPMTKNITDNAILLSAMTGEDVLDKTTVGHFKDVNYLESINSGNVNGLRFGVLKTFLRDSLYNLAVKNIESLGGIIIEIEPENARLEGFGTVLNGDMKVDFPNYLAAYGSDEVLVKTVADVVKYNLQDTFTRIPYKQAIFDGIVAEEVTPVKLDSLKTNLFEGGTKYFENPMQEHQLDIILSMNNRSAGYAATAKYPCLTVPMGYNKEGQPAGITFIARSFEEEKLLKVGYMYEQATKHREIPEGYN